MQKINHAFSWAFILRDFLNDGVFPATVATRYEARWGGLRYLSDWGL